jgi:hypothetical protein
LAHFLGLRIRAIGSYGPNLYRDDTLALVLDKLGGIGIEG